MYVQTNIKVILLLSNEKNSDCMLNGCLFFSSAKLARSLGKIADDAFRKLGFSPSHALLLYVVNQRNGIYQKEIGELLHLMPSTITRFIEKLEASKLVCRTNEGKNVYLTPTEKGLLMQPEIVEAWNNLHDSYSDILTPEECHQFITICNKLMTHIDNNI